MNQLSNFKIILYPHRSFVKFQNNFVVASINNQVSKKFCTRIDQLSSFETILYPHQSFIKFQNSFVPASTNYQLLK